MNELEIVKDIASISAPLINAIIEVWLKPKLHDLRTKGKIKKSMENYLLFGDSFQEYLNRSYQKYYYLNTIVFQNQQMRLEDLYLPLTVNSSTDKKTFKIDEYTDEFIPKYKKVLITDTAGMGKSTILKWLFLSCINKNACIPIFIELRKLSKEKTVLKTIFEELNSIDEKYDEQLILSLIKLGDFVFFFDGFDEIPLKEKEAVTQDIQDFIVKANKNYFIMSSRPEPALASFGGFQSFSIEPLKINEAFQLIRKYDKSSGELSKRLIEKIKEDKIIDNIKEFLGNPMLVSLLYKAYDYKPDIPLNKRTFYRQVYDALFESHDFTKGYFIREKLSSLDIDSFHKILRSIGYFTFKEGKIEYSKDEIISVIKKAKEYCIGIEFSESRFLEDLVVSVPLFCIEGISYKWKHKSIQDYFTAEFISYDTKDKQPQILQSLCKSRNCENYHNVIDLCYEADYKTFRHTIIYELLNNFIDYYNSSYKSFSREVYKEADIDIRKTITFGRTILVQKTEKEKIYKVTRDNDKRIINGWIKQVKEHKDDSSGELISSYFHFSYDMITAVTDSNITFLCRLLNQKRDKNLFKRIRLARNNNVINIDRHKFFKVDDNIDNPLNNEKTFAAVNDLIIYITNDVYNDVYLDYKNCVKVKKDIEKELSIEKDNEFLIEGIL